MEAEKRKQTVEMQDWTNNKTEEEKLKAEIARKEKRIKELEKVVVELGAENARLKSLLDDSQQQLEAVLKLTEDLDEEVKELKQKPFRRSKKKEKGEATELKKRGRPVGSKGSGRKKPEEVDYSVFIAVEEEICRECETELTGKGVQRERVIEDIDLRRPTITTRYIIEQKWCPKCRSYQESPVTSALPSYRLGLNLMLFVVYQKVAMGLSYPKIQRELSLYYSLEVTTATLINMVHEVSRLFGSAYARLIALMRQQATLHLDETTWPVDGKRHWLWIFINDVVTVYVLSRSRGSKVPKALLGQDFEGVIISDFFSAYSPLDVQKAKCWAHLLRDTHAFTKGKPPPDDERLLFHQQLHHLFIEMTLCLELAIADESCRLQLQQDMRQQLLTFAQQDWQDPDCLRLAARILKYLDDLLVWLVHPEVSPDNNLAERGLRPAVVTRKTSFGSRSKRGAQAFVRLLSLIRTWESQGLDFFDTASSSLSQACS